MFNIPDAYKLDYQVNLKDFIPKVLKSKDKNRIKIHRNTPGGLYLSGVFCVILAENQKLIRPFFRL